MVLISAYFTSVLNGDFLIVHGQRQRKPSQCAIVQVSPQSLGFGAGNLTIHVVGATDVENARISLEKLDSNQVLPSLQLVSHDLPDGSVEFQATFDTTSEGLYTVSVVDQSVGKCESSTVVQLKDGYELLNVFLEKNQSSPIALDTHELDVEGKTNLLLQVDGIYNAPYGEALVKFDVPDWGISAVTAAEIIRTPEGLYSQVEAAFMVRVVTPTLSKPREWFSGCDDASNPVPSLTCVPPVYFNVSVSLDNGESFSAPLIGVFGYKRPYKVAFLYVGPVDDFGWTYNLNQGRLDLEDALGSTIDAKLYYEEVEEGQFESQQKNKGETISTGTPVPERFADGKSNKYYPALELMRELCDADFDLVVAGSLGFQLQARDVSSGYRGCSTLGNGSDPSATEHNTYFMVAGGETNVLSPRMSTGFSKIYQARYLAGLVAGGELRRRNEERAVRGEGPTCVGYIAALPIPEIQRGMNAFLVGCRETYPECSIKTAFVGTFREPKVETDLARYFFQVANCEVLTQHSDTLEPQKYYQSVGGASFGYNSDSRSLIGDSVLASAILQWGAVYRYFIDSLSAWDASVGLKPAWLGFEAGAVKLTSGSSSLIPVEIRELVEKRKQELETASESTVLRHIFCGELRYRWTMQPTNDDTGRVDRGCGGQPIWVRLNETRALDSVHYSDENGAPLEPNATIASSHCLTEDALLYGPDFDNGRDGGSLYNNYLLDGIELLTPGKSLYGIINNASSHECYSDYGPLGDRFFTPIQEYPKCNFTQWQIYRQTCDASSETSKVVYSWVDDPISGQPQYCSMQVDAAGKYSTVAELPLVENGPACDYISWGSSSALIAIIMVVLGVMFNTIFVALLRKYRKHLVVRATQPLLVTIMCFGAMGLNLSTLAFIGEPTNVSCPIRVWTFNIFFDLVFAFLWAKIYRVHRLFTQAKKFRRVHLSEIGMIKIALSFVLIDIVIMTLWTTLDPPVPQATKEIAFQLPYPALGSIDFIECKSSSQAYMSASLTFKILLILSACFFTYSASKANIPANFVEYPYLVFSIYNTAVFSSIVMLLNFTVGEDPSIALIIQATGVAIGTCLVTGSLIIPRVGVALGMITIPNSSETAETTTRTELKRVSPGSSKTLIRAESSRNAFQTYVSDMNPDMNPESRLDIEAT